MNREKRNAAARSEPPEGHVGRPRGSPGRGFVRPALLAGLALLLVVMTPGAVAPAAAQTFAVGSETVYYSDEASSFPHSSWGPVGCDADGALNVTAGSSAVELNHTLNFFSCWSSGPFAGPVPAGTWTVDLWLHTYAGIGSNNQIRYELWIVDSDDPTAFPAGVRCVTGGVFDCDPTIGTEAFVVTNTVPQEHGASFSVPEVPFDNFHFVSYLFPAGEVNRTFLFTYNAPAGLTGDSRWTRPILVPAELNIIGVVMAVGVVVVGLGFFNLMVKPREERSLEDLGLFLVLILVFAVGAGIALTLFAGG